MLAKEEDDGWDDVGEGDLVVLDMRAESFDVEFGHYREGPAAIEALVNTAC